MLNHVILMGRLTREPETKYLQGSDSSVTRFNIAVERDYKAAGEENAKSDFINCTAWNKTGEFISKYFKKGSMIAVTGSIETGSYTDKDGKKVYTTEVKASKAYFTGERRESAGGSSPVNNADGNDFMYIPDGVDDFPFN